MLIRLWCPCSKWKLTTVTSHVHSVTAWVRIECNSCLKDIICLWLVSGSIWHNFNNTARPNHYFKLQTKYSISKHGYMFFLQYIFNHLMSSVGLLIFGNTIISSKCNDIKFTCKTKLFHYKLEPVFI